MLGPGERARNKFLYTTSATHCLGPSRVNQMSIRQSFISVIYRTAAINYRLWHFSGPGDRIRGICI